MKWLSLFLLLIPAASAQVWSPAVWTPGTGIPVRVQGCGTNQIGFTSSLSCTFSQPIATGSAVVIGARCFNSPSADVGGVAATLVDDDSASSGMVDFYILNVSGSPTTATITCPGSNADMIMAEEIMRIATSAALDAHAKNFQNTNSGTTDGVTSGSITTTSDGDYIWSITHSSPNGGNHISPGTGYTGLQAAAASGIAIGPYDGGTYRWTFEDENSVQTFHGAIAATFTSQLSFYQFTTLVMALKP